MFNEMQREGYCNRPSSSWLALRPPLSEALFTLRLILNTNTRARLAEKSGKGGIPPGSSWSRFLFGDNSGDAVERPSQNRIPSPTLVGTTSTSSQNNSLPLYHDLFILCERKVGRRGSRPYQLRLRCGSETVSGTRPYPGRSRLGSVGIADVIPPSATRPASPFPMHQRTPPSKLETLHRFLACLPESRTLGLSPKPVDCHPRAASQRPVLLSHETNFALPVGLSRL